MGKSSAALKLVSDSTRAVPHSSRIEWVLLSELRIDPEAQRALNKPWVKQRVSQFDADQLGYMVVNRRKDGHLYIIDGQHRAELLRAVGWGNQKVACELFDGLTQKEEAALFIARNTRINVRTFDKFRVRVTAGEPTAVDIHRIVLDCGLALSQQIKGEGQVNAVASLERIYRGAGITSGKNGAAVLSRALRTIQSAWGRESANFEGAIVEGVGLVLTRYNKIDAGILAAKLGKFAGGAAGLRNKARQAREVHGGTLSRCIAGLIVERYNRGKSSAKLESWWS